MTSFVLKIIAVFSMVVDHLGYACFNKITFLNVIGRLAFPIFAFQISEGYIHTKNIYKYLIRLIIFALISQIPFYLFLSFVPNSSPYGLNIFFTLSLGLLSILIYDKFFGNKSVLYKIFGFYCVTSLAIIALLLNCDYGAFGVVIIFLFYLFRNNKLVMSLAFILTCILYFLTSIIKNGYLYLIMCIFSIIPIIFIWFYNGKQGYKVKYLLYLFYPIHLFVLYFIFK